MVRDVGEMASEEPYHIPSVGYKFYIPYVLLFSNKAKEACGHAVGRVWSDHVSKDVTFPEATKIVGISSPLDYVLWLCICL